MADIYLKFGVLGGGDLKGETGQEIWRGLNSIALQINNNPFKIKFEADPVSLQKFRDDIKGITDSLSSFGQISLNIPELKTIEQTLGAISLRMQKLTQSGTGFGKMLEIDSSGIDDVLAKLKDIKDVVDSINAGGSGKGGGRGSKATNKTFYDMVAEMQRLVSGNTNAAGTSPAYKEVSNVLNKWVAEADNVRSGTKTLSKALDDLGLTGKNNAEKLRPMVETLAKLKEELAVTNAAGSTTDKQVRDMVASLNRYAKSSEIKTLDGNSSTNMQRLLDEATKIETMWANPATNAKDMADELTRAKELLSFIKAEASKVASIPLSDQPEKQKTALQQVQAAIDNVDRNLNNWTAAVGTEDYKHLQSAREELADLFNSVATGNITAEEFKQRFADAFKTVAASSRSIKDAGKNTESLTDRMGSLTQKFSTWFGVSQIVMHIVSGIKQMIRNVSELDTAMTELRKVTNETEASYAQFLIKATERAKRLGTTITDIVKASADFARLGYNVADASALADAATVYKNVGDGIENIDDASASIISTMQAFGVAAQDAMRIVDRFNEVGNSFAISSAGVGEALLNSASALAAGNNTLDESIALITAANETVQNTNKVGTALKTVSMFLRAAKTEAEDAGESTDGMANSVSELRGEILRLTGNRVDIQIDED